MKNILLLGFVALVACSKDEKPAPTAPSPAASSAAPAAAANAAKVTELGPGKQRVDGQNFTLDLASTACKTGAECTLTIKLNAAPDYHVNKEYPYKFTANPAPGEPSASGARSAVRVTFLGKKDAYVFAKDSGDFVEEGEKTATMTVRFKPSATGEAKISGTYKMSICSADQCQIEAQPLALNVPVN